MKNNQPKLSRKMFEGEMPLLVDIAITKADGIKNLSSALKITKNTIEKWQKSDSIPRLANIFKLKVFIGDSLFK